MMLRNIVYILALTLRLTVKMGLKLIRKSTVLTAHSCSVVQWSQKLKT